MRRLRHLLTAALVMFLICGLTITPIAAVPYDDERMLGQWPSRSNEWVLWIECIKCTEDDPGPGPYDVSMPRIPHADVTVTMIVACDKIGHTLWQQDYHAKTDDKGDAWLWVPIPPMNLLPGATYTLSYVAKYPWYHTATGDIAPTYPSPYGPYITHVPIIMHPREGVV